MTLIMFPLRHCLVTCCAICNYAWNIDAFVVKYILLQFQQHHMRLRSWDGEKTFVDNNSVLWQNGKQLSEIRINDTTTTCLVIIVLVNDILETSGDVHACSSFVKYKLCTIIISQKSHAPDSKHEVSFSTVYYHMSREYVTYAILFLIEGDCADAIRIMRWYIGLDLDKCSTFDSYLFHTK